MQCRCTELFESEHLPYCGLPNLYFHCFASGIVVNPWFFLCLFAMRRNPLKVPVEHRRKGMSTKGAVLPAVPFPTPPSILLSSSLLEPELS